MSKRQRATMLRFPWIALMLTCIAGFTEATEKPKNEIEANSGSAASVDALLADNTRTFPVSSKAGTEVIRVINQYLKPAYAQRNISLLASVLSSDFDYYYLVDDETIAVENREMFLNYRRKWEATSDITVAYSVQDVTALESDENVIVTALSTHNGQYFSPRFLETLVFRKDGEWKLRRQSVFPLYASQPDAFAVQILVAPLQWAISQEWQAAIAQIGANRMVEEFRSHSVDEIPGTESPHAVLFVFREPPAQGARIRVEHQFWRPWATKLRPYVFNYTVGEGQPYFLIENRTQAGGQGGTITFRVFVDELKIAERSIPIT